ncbi:hypothetical protein DH2020_037419 [Rehmannia glutinosa]|uniref:Calmodulin-binding domain-containing protein n=1 Tax=Rehmannia glutinosa TaxID=99300 RepID=A0ABR0V2M8_REHGL
MAEESIDPLVTPEKCEFDSTEMDKSSAENRANISQHRVPIYLRASTGSCHDICKYGRRHAFEEKPREPLWKRMGKTSPNELKSVKTIVSGKQKIENIVKHELSSADMNKRSPLVKTSPETKSYSPKLKASFDASPRQNASSRIKTTHLPNSAINKSSVSKPPEIIKREIVLPSEKVEVPMKEGDSNDNKVSIADKHIFDQSVKLSSSVRSKLIKVKPLSDSGDSYGLHGKDRRNSDVQTGRKMTSSTTSSKKALQTPAPPFRFSLSNIASSKARKVGRVKLLSPLKNRNGIHGIEIEKSNSEDSDKTLHVIKTKTEKTALNPKAKKAGSVKLLSPLKYRNGIKGVETEKSNSENSEKTLHVIKTETENNALDAIPDDNAIQARPSSSSPISSSHAKSPSSLSCEEDDEEIKNIGNEADESVSENVASMEIGNIQLVKENHTHAKSPSSLSREDDDEKIKYSDIEADESVTEKTVSLEISNLQPLKENQDNTPTLSSHEKDDEEIYPSSSKSSSHAKSPSLSSLDEDDEEINHGNSEADEFVSDKTISMEIDKVQPVKENRKTLRKNRSVLSDDKNRSPVKLKFRRGKIVDLQQENNIPRRLRFRSARVGDNKTDDLVTDNKKSMETGNVKPATPNKTLRKSRSVVSEDKYHSPVNLIRREKAVEFQTGNNSPTRLRFRKGKNPVAEDAKVDMRRRTIKRAGGKNDAAGAEFSSRKVILKHQDVQRKKNGQILLNNVIEETASKLVESRKSKVKALVGAFETVISLQEPKPSSHTVS